MKVDIDSNSGFCFGVTSAIRKAEDELKRGPLYCLGDIVHNSEEVTRLEQSGLITIDHNRFASLKGGRVLLRAHGEPPATYTTARRNSIEIIDASCPVVLHLQKQIRNIYNLHPEAQMVIFGKVGHAEVIGLQGQTDNTAIIIESTSDLHNIDWNKDIYLFSQTTMSVDSFHNIITYIKQQLHDKGTEAGQFQYFDTICRNVANRIEKLISFAKGHDIVLFVGGKKSSNAKVLYQHCLQANNNTYFIENDADIDSALIHTIKQHTQNNAQLAIGICGATSTPLWLMEQCKERIMGSCII